MYWKRELPRLFDVQFLQALSPARREMRGMQEIDLSPNSLWHKQYNRANDLQKRLDQWRTFGYGVMVVAACLLLQKCEYTDYAVEFDSPDIVMRENRLWGFTATKTIIAWRDGQWMTQDRQGKWHVAIEEPYYDPPDSTR